MNIQTTNNALLSCFQELTSNLSDQEKQEILKRNLINTTTNNYKSFKYPTMNIQISIK
jgi:hypothetical protein